MRSDVIVITTDGRTDRHSSNVLEFRADQMSPGNIRSQINISMCPTCTDKTNITNITNSIMNFKLIYHLGQISGKFLS